MSTRKKVVVRRTPRRQRRCSRKLKVGDYVKVTKASDFACPEAFVGHAGVVINFNTNGQTGNDERNPLIGVRFAKHITYHPYCAPAGETSRTHTYSFWRSELRRLP